MFWEDKAASDVLTISPNEGQFAYNIWELHHKLNTTECEEINSLLSITFESMRSCNYDSILKTFQPWLYTIALLLNPCNLASMQAF